VSEHMLRPLQTRLSLNNSAIFLLLLLLENLLWMMMNCLVVEG
jgi:hypothetical protein